MQELLRLLFVSCVRSGVVPDLRHKPRCVGSMSLETLQTWRKKTHKERMKGVLPERRVPTLKDNRRLSSGSKHSGRAGRNQKREGRENCRTSLVQTFKALPLSDTQGRIFPAQLLVLLLFRSLRFTWFLSKKHNVSVCATVGVYR